MRCEWMDGGVDEIDINWRFLFRFYRVSRDARGKSQIAKFRNKD